MSCLLFFINYTSHFVRIRQDQIHRFIPTFKISIYFSPSYKLNYESFVLMFMHFYQTLLGYFYIQSECGHHCVLQEKILQNFIRLNLQFKQNPFITINNQLKEKFQESQKMHMRQFEARVYKGIPPFGTSLFHRQIKPNEQSFLQMARFTLFPYFTTYTFCFFWILLICFVFIYSQSYHTPVNYIQIDRNDQFLKVTQGALFELGQNYPYHIVYNYHYYRVLTSMVLFRNFHHFLLTCIGVLTIGSYIQNAIGFKRCFVLAIVTGVIGILANNIINKNATLESTTPVTGIIGYSFGYFFQHCNKEWKYYINEKINMILLLLFLCCIYGELIVSYSNINAISNGVALASGFLFCYADPGENESFKLGNIVVILIMAGVLTVIIITFFFHTQVTNIQT